MKEFIIIRITRGSDESYMVCLNRCDANKAIRTAKQLGGTGTIIGEGIVSPSVEKSIRKNGIFKI